MSKVSAVDATEFSTREEWARLFIAHNPDAHAFDIIGAYNRTDLSSHLGAFSLAEILELQAQMGAGGITRESRQNDEDAAERHRARKKDEAERALRLTPRQLTTLADRDLVRAAMIRLQRRIEDGGVSVIEALPAPVRQVWAVVGLDADVRNGGFGSYFRNRSDDVVDDAIEGFRAMLAMLQADITARAAAAFQRKSPAGMHAARSNDGLDEDLSTFDTEYFDSFPDGRAGITPYVATHIRAHATVF